MSIEPHVYYGPGKYIAICNKTNFNGHYIKHFTVPDTIQDPQTEAIIPTKAISASWYFLNVIDFEACVEAVYPLSLLTHETLSLLKDEHDLKVKEIARNPPWLATK